MTPTRRGTPISRRRLAQLADVLEHQAAVAGPPDWHAVVAAGEELVRGGSAQLRRSENRRARGREA
jgi:hypothetical protein